MIDVVKPMMAGVPDSGSRPSVSELKKKKLLFWALSAVLLISDFIGVAVGVESRENSDEVQTFLPSHSIIKTTCGSTLYPDLCVSAITAVDGVSKKVSSPKDVIELSLNITIKAVKKNHLAIEKLKTREGLTKRQKVAVDDCLEDLDDTLYELGKAVEDLHLYPTKKSLAQHADDLKTLLSSTITNQESCLDGFSYDDADRKVRKLLLKAEIHLEKLCSNALAMIKNMTDTDIINERKMMGRKKLTEEMGHDDIKWPDWLSGSDRRLLQSSSVTPNVVVAADGSGDYRTVSEAVAAAPSRSSTRYVIRIKAGVYRENVDVPRAKTNIMFMGDGKSTTIITGSRNVVDGSTTFHSATVAAVGDNFLARDLTFENTAGPSKHQAVALRVGSDLSAFYQCNMLAYQDTLYVHSNRQFFVHCLVTGTVDFIFGNGAAVLQNCDIRPRRPNSGQRNMVTAQGRTDPNQNTGIVIQKCIIAASSDLASVQSSFPTYLGRPWKQYSRTVVMQTAISNVINPAGWHIWDGDFALDTLFYGEYRNTGAGADTSNRVTWKGFKVITSASEAEAFTPGKFIAGGSWLSATGFPFTLGL